MFIDARVTPARELRATPLRPKGRRPPKRLSRIRAFRSSDDLHRPSPKRLRSTEPAHMFVQLAIVVGHAAFVPPQHDADGASNGWI